MANKADFVSVIELRGSHKATEQENIIFTARLCFAQKLEIGVAQSSAESQSHACSNFLNRLFYLAAFVFLSGTIKIAGKVLTTPIP